MESRICTTPHGAMQSFIQETNSGRSNPAETNELGNHRKNRRAAGIRQKRDDRAKNRKFKARDYLHPSHRHDHRSGDEDGCNLAVRDGHHRTVVVFRNGPAVQPRMQGCADFGHRHE